MALYMVATPIGNLQDITLRALDTLKVVEKIYCEDTRRTKQLLSAYNIQTPVDSLHHHSSTDKIAYILRELERGGEFAYVTDAGTPGVADPGGVLVEQCHERGIRVVPIPGPSSVTTILSVAGMPANDFCFFGYVPTKKGRQAFIQKLVKMEGTAVLFETAPRLLKFLSQLIDLGGSNKKVVIGRELTKQFEEIKVGLPGELYEYFSAHPPRGEFVLCVRSSLSS